MRLLKNAVIVKQFDPETQTKWGIYIPEKLIEPRNRGIVTHIGDTVNTSLLGKEILFQLEASQKFDFEETQGRLIFVSDILATL